MTDYDIKTSVEEIDRGKWNDFVHNHPNGNIFQCPEMYDVYNNTKYYYPFSIIVKRKDDIVGCLTGTTIKQGSALISRFSSRAIISGGPLVVENDPVIVSILLKALDEYLENQVVYVQFRNNYDTNSIGSTFNNFNYNFQDHLNILIDILLDEDKMLEAMHKERRHNIRRAIKKGLSVQVSSAIKDIDSSYTLLTNLYKKIKLPLADKSLFINAVKYLAPKNYLKIFNGYLDSQLVSSRIALCYKNKIYDWYAGTDDKYLNYYPNDLIPWEMIKWGKSNGFKTFDFGGAGKPNIPYGVRDFKLKLGGKLVNYGRYQKVKRRFIYNLGEKSISIYRSLLNK